jgi:hypothetical protein
MNDRPVGKRFSHVYLERGSPSQDSARFRRRLLQAFYDANTDRLDFHGVLEGELGVQIDYLGYGWDWQKYFTTAALRDILDTITIVYGKLHSGGFTKAKSWRETAARIIREENLGYSVDEVAGVHLGVDEEFEHNRAATIMSLGTPRYGSALDSFERALRALDEHPADARTAIQRTFEACETVFRLILGKKVSRLGSAEIQSHLQPLLKDLFQGTSLNAANMMSNSFADWVNGAHQYRHAKGVQAPEPPPLGLAVLMVSVGASFVRWLVEIDGSPERSKWQKSPQFPHT